MGDASSNFKQGLNEDETGADAVDRWSKGLRDGVTSLWRGGASALELRNNTHTHTHTHTHSRLSALLFLFEFSLVFSLADRHASVPWVRIWRLLTLPSAVLMQWQLVCSGGLCFITYESKSVFKLGVDVYF
jgi:hypothetical protein